jgi:hypothetical protein
MTPHRISLQLLLALAALLLAASPAFAGAHISVEGDTLVYDGTVAPAEPDNVTISQSGDTLVLSENASRPTAAPGCTLSANSYRVSCPATGVSRISVRTSDLGSDVRIRADLPTTITGGKGDDVLIGGPGDDTIDGGSGQDVLGGGLGADTLSGGRDKDLVTYADRIASDGTLVPRRSGVHVAIDAPGASGASGEGDTIANDVEQLEGTDGNDTFDLRDGVPDQVLCDGGRDLVLADLRDDPGIDCETTRVAPSVFDDRLTIPTLAFPFTGHADHGGGSVDVGPLLPLQHGAVVIRVHCPVAIGLLDIAGPGCRGRVRFSRGGTVLASMRVSFAHGRTLTLKVPLTSSRSLARRASGLALTVTAQPAVGAVRRFLRFRVRG